MPNSQPCGSISKWVGLICRKNVVFGLQLEQMGLSGNIDILSLIELSGLRTISIMNNSFVGTIPEFNRLASLRSVYLSGNKFFGAIPQDYFSKMTSVKKVLLSNNAFTCQIPSSLTALPNLLELRLENNHFSGSIPDFSQKSLSQVDFSINKLEGEIPPGLSKFEARVFAGNLGLCGAKLSTLCKKPQASPPETRIKIVKPRSKRKTWIRYIAFGTLASLLLIVLVVLLFGWKKKHSKKKDSTDRNHTDQPENMGSVEVQVTVPPARRETDKLSRSQKGGGVGGSGRRLEAELVVVNNEKGAFGLPDLMKAKAKVLGGGGSTFTAVMVSGLAVVVKRVRVMNHVEKQVFEKEMRFLGSLRHQNVLPPLAYHFRKDEKLLVHEFVPRGSLLSILHGEHAESQGELDWPARLKIIQGIARGMAYLHAELALLDAPHGNLKSSNVLLKSDKEPLLTEFGFQRLINPDDLSQCLAAYRSPEATAENGAVSPKSDVFCLGVVILEILTGKFLSQYVVPGKAGGAEVVDWVGPALETGQWMELLDPVVVGVRNSLGEIEKVLQIGNMCTTSDPDQRPAMTEAARMILDVRLFDNSLGTKKVLLSQSDGIASTLGNGDHYQQPPH